MICNQFSWIASIIDFLVGWSSSPTLLLYRSFVGSLLSLSLTNSHSPSLLRALRFLSLSLFPSSKNINSVWKQIHNKLKITFYAIETNPHLLFLSREKNVHFQWEWEWNWRADVVRHLKFVINHNITPFLYLIVPLNIEDAMCGLFRFQLYNYV